MLFANEINYVSNFLNKLIPSDILKKDIQPGTNINPLDIPPEEKYRTKKEILIASSIINLRKLISLGNNIIRINKNFKS